MKIDGKLGGTGTVKNPDSNSANWPDCVKQIFPYLDDAKDDVAQCAKTHFDTGAQRDTQDGKPNFYECLSPFAIWRYGLYMAKASAKYGEWNWSKGIPVESYMKSLERHLVKLKMDLLYGHEEEPGVDHAAAILFNIQGLLHELEVTKRGMRL